VSERISISLPRDLAEKIEEYAEEHGMKTSHVVQEGMKGFLEPEAEEPEEPEEAVWEKRIEKAINKVGSEVGLLKSRLRGQSEQSEEEIEEERHASQDILQLVVAYGNFDIEGFIEEIEATNVDVTDSDLQNMALLFKIGYEGYLIKPNWKEKLSELSVALGLSKKQRKVLMDKAQSFFESEEEGESEEEEEEEEKDEW